MTLLDDLSEIISDPVRAKSIHRIVFAKDRSRQHAYDYLVEAARLAALGIVRVSALLLKYDDERRERNSDARPVNRPGTRETWSARTFFNAVSSYDKRYPELTRQDLMLLVAELTMLGLRKLPTNSKALAYVEEQFDQLLVQLSETDEDSVKQFRSLKLHWLHRNIEQRDIEAGLEEQLEKAVSVRQEFMKIFGQEFLAERTQFCRMNIAKRRLQLLKENPGVNVAEIERMLGKGKNHRHAKLSRHQLDLPPGYLVSVSGYSIPGDNSYSRARSLLGQISSLTHPDKSRQHQLGRSQRKQLESIWHETAALRAERSNKPVLTRSVAFLENRLQLARRILELAHIEDLDASLVVQGSTIEEQIQWLEEANQFVDERIGRLQADSLHCSRNSELADMHSLVEASEEAQEAERRAMVEKCETFKKRADVLERRADRLIGACGR
jgi:hypothetical protein